MNVNGENYRAVWLENNTVKMIDQAKLPHEFSIKQCDTYQQTAEAISKMNVRGAPTIASTAAYGMAQAALTHKGLSKTSFWEHMDQAKKTFNSTRPLEPTISNAVERVYTESNKEELNIGDWKELAVKEAQEITEEYVLECMRIGEFGSELIKNGTSMLTHGNDGALATVDWGTALAPIRIAFKDSKKIFVVVDESRPLCQGSRLTSWELLQEKIPHVIISDTAAGFYMQKEKIDLCIMGADRVTSEGDVVNVIGTYEKAVLAKENDVPFYVAAPSAIIEMDTKSKNIDIEERPEEEVLFIKGKAKLKTEEVRIAPEKARALNPASDLTPAKYITGIITEKGIVKPKKLKTIF